MVLNMVHVFELRFERKFEVDADDYLSLLQRFLLYFGLELLGGVAFLTFKTT